MPKELLSGNRAWRLMSPLGVSGFPMLCLQESVKEEGFLSKTGGLACCLASLCLLAPAWSLALQQALFARSQTADLYYLVKESKIFFFPSSRL